MVTPRDYYADLELPPTAGDTEIKKQYRKLALKYHPDRNPGREQEVNPKFLIIQSAHDVLTDPQQKAKFDASRARSAGNRYPASSGVRGNPWSNLSQQFPTPPRRQNASPRNPTSGAERWNTRFSSGVPPTARQQTAADAQTKKNTAKAFDHMRGKPAPTAKQAHQNRAPPPTPPRTESARQRAQASFGASKPGKPQAFTHHPRTFPYEDEPPAAKNGYSSRSQFTTHHEPDTVPMTDPLRQFRGGDTFADARQRTPYASHGGEKTDPFDGVNLGRSKSTKETPSRYNQEETPTKKKSWSGESTGPPQEATNAKKPPTTTERPRRLSGAWPGDARPSRSTSRDGQRPSIFNLSENTTIPEHRKSVDDIDTSFVKDHDVKWQFNAGGSEQGSKSQPPKAKSQSNGRRSPLKSFEIPQPDFTGGHKPPMTPTKDDVKGFNAEGWNDQFGPQTFVPQSRPTTGSPSKNGRANSMKAKASKPAKATSYIVIEDSSDDEPFNWPGRKGTEAPVTDSPQAMDIDPPTESATDLPLAPGARNIPVEPTRPEWRSGNFSKVAEEPKAKVEELKINPNTMGSEDTEEFKSTMEDLNHVAPFAEQKSGLDSLSGMRDNLPFESKASGTIPSEEMPTAQPLVFPDSPPAPRLPPTVAVNGMKPNMASWAKYSQEFESYLRQWDMFNERVTDHFATRKAQICKLRKDNGYAFLQARGDRECLEYVISVQQDNDVRRRWNAACEEHETRLGEFMLFREKMK